ncbi:phospholipase C [Jatrophihabitans sp. GAS493]|uniref:phosphocholine-specific phospholipase C n=1 Tax=Jatrophihabitans sp. GAS493 TaxID=1907575 RepID=UPI000BB829C5|nr:phospholipase C, phosphocholine-specific [Jatrophihabitans sp. GAS493]SOD71729.1 phospholipase C [Jatrophihabitans sp. GAS493]
MSGVSRRNFLGGAAAAAGAVAASQLPGAGTADAATVPSADPAAKRGHRGSIKDVKHVVILMQENRSFDHYYGSLGGVRGFADRQALTYPRGGDVFAQPDLARLGTSTLSPFHMDTTRFNAQEASDLDHSWLGTHAAWNGGAWDGWVGAKGEETMGYFTRADIPWQYALADAFTICDQYFCSIQGPTTPNRLYLWTGTIDPQGQAGGPAISNPDDYLPVYNWKTYPERLQQAGVSWQVYANDEVGDGDDGWLGDYGDNPLWLFQAYHDALASSDPKVRQLADRASLRTEWKPDSGQGQNVDHVLQQFIDDCASGSLPTVSWVVAPYGYCEHPRARPADGANYTNRVLRALWENPKLWESTAVLINFDENDGFFDHIPAPFAGPGTPGEIVDGLPIGLGPRVPMTVVSPWSRGGWVNSQTHDHTSVIRFLEQVTGVREPNISDWRRAVCGDLTSCFDFDSFDPSIPKLPDTAELVAEADREKSLPAVAIPALGGQPAPITELGGRKSRTLGYRADGNLSVDTKTGQVTATVTNLGSLALPLSVYSTHRVPFVATPLLVRPGESASYPNETLLSGLRYDLALHGPDGFLRTFAGAVTLVLPHAGAIPGASVRLPKTATDAVLIRLENRGRAGERFTIRSNDHGPRKVTVLVTGGGHSELTWPTVEGRYDFTITADTDPHFAYRYAGRIGVR